jgi:hypothetical protein
MSTPAQVGRNEWRHAIQAARQANDDMRGLLKRMLREGNPVVQALAGQAALVLMDNETAISRLDEIGRNTK